MVKRGIYGIVVALLGASVLAGGAAAKDGDVVRVGTCTGASTTKVKLSDEDGRIEAEVEVDQNRNGVRWTVALYRNGAVVGRRAGVTRGPSGSFEARFVTRNGAGVDRFVARLGRVGERCVARAAF
jgi:hypothetical protein